MDAGIRVLALLYSWFVIAFVGTIAFVVGFIWMVIDVIIQLILGRDGLSSTGRIASWIRGTFNWSARMTNFALTGEGGFELFPSPA